MTDVPTPLVSSRKDYLGGTPCFHGTRVPVQTLFDYLVAGHPLIEFLEDFPDVSEEHAKAVLAQAAAHIAALEPVAA
jgi:uncharacterized protein (DUF433 family)